MTTRNIYISRKRSPVTDPAKPTSLKLLEVWICKSGACANSLVSNNNFWKYTRTIVIYIPLERPYTANPNRHVSSKLLRSILDKAREHANSRVTWYYRYWPAKWVFDDSRQRYLPQNDPRNKANLIEFVKIIKTPISQSRSVRKFPRPM
jgi:hypothetical protein